MKHKIFITVMIVAIALISIISATATDNRIYYLTDPATDMSYTVTINSSLVTISKEDSEIGYTKLKDIYCVSIYDNILTLYTIDVANEILGVFSFDFYSDTIDSTAINTVVFDNPACFTSDNAGRIYYVSGKDTRIVCVNKNGNTNEINLKSQIKQLFCINKETVIAVTNDNVYLLNDTEAVKLLDYTLSEPISYIGNNLIKDSNGKKYICGDNFLQEYISATESVVPETASTQPGDTANTSTPEFYSAEAGITVSKIKKAFADFEISKVTKADGTYIKSGKVGTGAKVYFAQGNVCTIIIRGELTGEGNINSRDIKAILNHLSKKELLQGEYLIAADVNEDGIVTTKDALLIANMY